jgi:hypothetical protein
MLNKLNFSRIKGKSSALVILLLSFLSVLMVISPGCGTTPRLRSDVIPYVPAEYLDCTPINSIDLLSYYYYNNRYSPAPGVEQNLNNQIFVFKNIEVTQAALKYATPLFIWMDGFVQCYFLEQGTATRLRAGDRVDVVGVNTGAGQEIPTTLVFVACVFLPAGAVQLPAVTGAGSGVAGSY